ncbi:DinB family protein [Tsukamurella soli]
MDDLDRTVYTHRDGRSHARNLAGLLSRRIADLLVHNWDLAKALGRSTADFDPELVAWTLEHYQSRFAGYERTDPKIIGSVAVQRPAPAGAGDADRLAAFMGRDVNFTA